MTFYSPQAARKEMFALVKTCWDAGTPAIVGSIPEIRYEGLEESALPGASKFWMRASTTDVSTRQKGFRNPDGAGRSEPVYEVYGFITLQIFAPMKGPQVWSKGELLSEVGQRMFMASETGGGVWFRNPRIQKLSNDGTWYRWNVLADYQFSQLKRN